MKGNYLVIDKRVLPDVYEKVVSAKKMLREGKVKEITEVTKIVGISRSVFYKYKDYVFEFSESSAGGKKATFSMLISHKHGVLSGILNYISHEGGNILTINQGIPINGSANLSITMDISELKTDLMHFLEDLGKQDEIEKVEFIAME